MLDGNEFNEGDPTPQDVFAAAVDKVRLGNAHTLPVLDSDSSVAKLKQLDPGLLKPFLDKARSFLGSAIDAADDYNLPEAERINHLSSIFKTEISTEAPRESEYTTTPINIQIMSLGALAFVGEADEVSRHVYATDPKEVETQEVTDHLRGTDQVLLNERERKIITALATGTEVGYGNDAGNKFGKLTANIHTHAGQRTEVPEQVGEDFI